MLPGAYFSESCECGSKRSDRPSRHSASQLSKGRPALAAIRDSLAARGSSILTRVDLFGCKEMDSAFATVAVFRAPRPSTRSEGAEAAGFSGFSVTRREGPWQRLLLASELGGVGACSASQAGQSERIGCGGADF